jgi:hypothetical protein
MLLSSSSNSRSTISSICRVPWAYAWLTRRASPWDAKGAGKADRSRTKTCATSKLSDVNCEMSVESVW